MNFFSGAKEHFLNMSKDVKSTAKMIIKSSSKWGKLPTVPSVDVDVILTFPSNSNMEFIQWLMKELVDNVPDLSFSLNYHRNADEYALYFTASYRSLLRGAEKLNIRKKISEEFGGGYREFNLEELDIFEDVSNEELFLSSQDRQRIILYWINTLKYVKHKTKFGINFYPNQNVVYTLKTKGKISQIFPLHNREVLKELEKSWVTKFTNPQPLDEIAGYFGVKIALYFAWLGHYTTALLIPTIVGIIGWQMTSQGNSDFYYLLTALFNILWATFYLKHWRRTCSGLTYKWGTIDYQITRNCENRTEFKGKTKICPITGEEILYYPNWKRQMTVYFVSLPTIIFCFYCVFRVSLIFSHFQEWVDFNIKYNQWWSILSPIPKILLAFVIGFMDDIYKKIAKKLNKWENHQLEDTYKNYMNTKLILFAFMNSFFSLFHIAFYLKDLGKLRDQLATLLITRQFIGNVKEIVVPFLNTRLRQTIMGIKYEQRRHKSHQSPIIKNCKCATNASADDSFSSSPPGVGTQGEHTKSERGVRPTDLPNTTRKRRKAPESHGESISSTIDLTSTILPPDDDDDLDYEDNDAEATLADDTLNNQSPEYPGDNESASRKKAQSCEDYRAAKLAQEILRNAPSCSCAPTPTENTLHQAEEEATLPKYDDPFEDFLEMFIQFAYVSMFACAFPLAGLFCLLNNILEIRSDAFKLISSFQRPFGMNVSSIGIWQKALEGLSYVAVAVNMGLLAVSGGIQRLMPYENTDKVVFVIIVIEHLVIVVKFLIEQATPNVPFWIEQERCNIENKRRQALKEMDIAAMKERRRNRASSCEPKKEDQASSSNTNINSSEGADSGGRKYRRTRSRTNDLI